MIGFNVNMNTMADLNEIYEICCQHSECKDCPVLEHKGLIKEQSVTICEKVEEKLRKEQMYAEKEN